MRSISASQQLAIPGVPNGPAGAGTAQHGPQQHGRAGGGGSCCPHPILGVMLHGGGFRIPLPLFGDTWLRLSSRL